MGLYIFVFAVIASSWMWMMAFHEFGHIVGAMTSGGQCNHVVLHPLAISRTDVDPNPHPSFVVWMGPLFGIIGPMFISHCARHGSSQWQKIICFWEGFCWVANGAYIGVGSFVGIGDCGEMLRTGTPRILMILFGLTCVLVGMFIWHGLGSLRVMFKTTQALNVRLVWQCVMLALGSAAVQIILFDGT